MRDGRKRFAMENVFMIRHIQERYRDIAIYLNPHIRYEEIDLL